jgi:hypothetical protein
VIVVMGRAFGWGFDCRLLSDYTHRDQVEESKRKSDGFMSH